MGFIRKWFKAISMYTEINDIRVEKCCKFVVISKQISVPMVNDDIIPKYNQYVILARKK